MSRMISAGRRPPCCTCTSRSTQNNGNGQGWDYVPPYTVTGRGAYERRENGPGELKSTMADVAIASVHGAVRDSGRRRCHHRIRWLRRAGRSAPRHCCTSAGRSAQWPVLRRHGPDGRGNGRNGIPCACRTACGRHLVAQQRPAGASQKLGQPVPLNRISSPMRTAAGRTRRNDTRRRASHAPAAR